MRFFIASMALASTFSGCATGVSAQPLAVELNRPFQLRPGASARLASAGLQIQLVAILADSRCRKGQQCISAGNAAVRIELNGSRGEVQTLDLHTAPNSLQTAHIGDIEWRLIDVEPLDEAATAQPSTHDTRAATLTASRRSTTEMAR